jgi:predicted N-acetyltransferase YhbS
MDAHANDAIAVTIGVRGREAERVELFATTFAASDGPEEGASVRELSRDLLASTAPEDLLVLEALAAGSLVGGVVFSRLRYDRDDRTSFLLAPLAVAVDRQGQGIGQRLVKAGLTELRRAGVDVVFTYGDPAFYGRVGFTPVEASYAAPPHPLRHPEGWLATALSDRGTSPLRGAARTVAAFDDPRLW